MIDDSVLGNKNSKKETVRGNVSCKIENLVYGVFCVKYVYIAETGGTFYQRMLFKLFQNMDTMHMFL